MTEDQLKPSLSSRCQHVVFPISSHMADLRSDWRGDRPESKEQEGKNEADRDDVDGEAITTKGPATWWQRRATNPSQDETAMRRQSSGGQVLSQTFQEHLPDGHCIAEQQTNDTKRVDGIKSNGRANTDHTQK